MTENEAIERLKCMRLFMEINDKQNESKFLEDDYIANKTAIQALEEIQQYRAIGTVEDFKNFKLSKKGFITIGQTIEDFEKEIRAKAIDEFAKWCYINGIDFSYMAKATDTEPFCKRVVRKFNEEQLKAGGEDGNK